MGNKPLRPAFWAQLCGTKAGPCRTCTHWLAWDVRPSYTRERDLVFALCRVKGICHEPEEGCDKWQREPGSDDD